MLDYSDAIVVIHPIGIDEETLDIVGEEIKETPLESTSRCIRKLIGATMSKSKKPTMLLFNKCDIFRDVAEEMMLDDCPDLSQDKLKENLKEAQQIQLLRKVFFKQNYDIVISRICQALPEYDLSKESEELYRVCEGLSNNGVRIQCISPLGSSDPNDANASPMYVEDFINMLIELCEEISNDKQKI